MAITTVEKLAEEARKLSRALIQASWAVEDGILMGTLKGETPLGCARRLTDEALARRFRSCAGEARKIAELLEG